jgi:iron complex transport system substrate-binding protein
MSADHGWDAMLSGTSGAQEVPRGDAENAEKAAGLREARRSLDEITGEIVDAAFKLHTGLGPGLLESVYETVLARELERRGLQVERQKPISFDFDGLHLNDCFRVDLMVEGSVVIEIKSVESLSPVHPKQVLTYLRLLRLPVGLLINFGAPRFKDGVRRIVNGLTPSASPRLRVNQTAQDR